MSIVIGSGGSLHCWPVSNHSQGIRDRTESDLRFTRDTRRSGFGRATGYRLPGCLTRRMEFNSVGRQAASGLHDSRGFFSRSRPEKLVKWRLRDDSLLNSKFKRCKRHVNEGRPSRAHSRPDIREKRKDLVYAHDTAHNAPQCGDRHETARVATTFARSIPATDYERESTFTVLFAVTTRDRAAHKPWSSPRRTLRRPRSLQTWSNASTEAFQ